MSCQNCEEIRERDDVEPDCETGRESHPGHFGCPIVWDDLGSFGRAVMGLYGEVRLIGPLVGAERVLLRSRLPVGRVFRMFAVLEGERVSMEAEEAERSSNAGRNR